MDKERLELLQGTPDLMVWQALAAMGPLHGYGIEGRIQQTSGVDVGFRGSDKP
jgi:hypothetical protein